MTDEKKPEVVEPINPKEDKPVLLVNMVSDEEMEDERQRVHGIVRDLVLAIHNDGPAVLQQLMDALGPAMEDGGPVVNVMEDPQAKIAVELGKRWTAAGYPIMRQIEVWDGHCVSETHSWFLVRGNPEILEDAKYTFLVDPAARGLVAVSGEKDGPGTDIAIIQPYSPFHQAYAGKRVRSSRLREEGSDE